MEQPALAVHHIGIAVPSIDEAMRFYGEKLGLSVFETLELPDRQLKVTFVQAANLLIELLEPTDTDTPVAGNPNGDVSLVEFFDYRCPYCKQVEPSLEGLLKEYPKLRIVHKAFPLLGEDSVFATRLDLAAPTQWTQGTACPTPPGTGHAPPAACACGAPGR